MPNVATALRRMRSQSSVASQLHVSTVLCEVETASSSLPGGAWKKTLRHRTDEVLVFSK